MERNPLKLIAAAVCAMSMTAGAQALECADVEWHPDVLAAYPEASQACLEVVEQDGKPYVKMKAQYEGITGNRVRLRIHENDGDRIIKTFRLQNPVTITAAGEKVNWRDLYSGYELTFMIPSDRFELAQVDSDEVVEVVAVEELPKTASVWPLVGMMGLSLLGVAGLVRRLRRS
ncbi:LPXTG cell wall anchor domain-containing protein [Echinimonas agarilytica]|uniref:LPXTG cell wall anchor domain-containing protein n=1 Tax=Echinimonas agarilytica TaxID=1215918 RepID=A0AA42B7B3_9GAMM|nr:LPXTG cell wall anchor domain-containing protein [Echinimonas agarilytica]MCM2679043.1 LPXTG cell wall anchor domain-containing protein [Echinimonas agarilytica]